MNGAKQLLRDIDKAFASWDERSSLRLKGKGGLSVADMDTLELYAEEYLRYGSIRGLMEPMGKIRAVLESYGINY